MAAVAFLSLICCSSAGLSFSALARDGVSPLGPVLSTVVLSASRPLCAFATMAPEAFCPALVVAPLPLSSEPPQPATTNARPAANAHAPETSFLMELLLLRSDPIPGRPRTPPCSAFGAPTARTYHLL